MTTQEIVSKLWNLCNVLRDDGITYHQYVTELTYILFLKMAKETGAERQIPEAYRWDKLTAKSGIELKKFYKELLTHLGDECTGRVREIYQGSATNIDEPEESGKDHHDHRRTGLVFGQGRRSGQSLRRLAGKERKRKEIGRGAVFYAPCADRRHDPSDEAAAG